MSFLNGILKLARPKKNKAITTPARQSDLLSWNVDTSRRHMAWIPDPDLVLKASGKKRSELALMLTDPAIKQAVDTRQNALVSTPWYLTPSEGDAPTFVWDNMNNIIGDVLICCFRALLFGFSVSERVYTVAEDGKIKLAAIRACPIADFVFDPYDNLKRKVDGSYKDVDLKYKYLLTRNNPTVENPYGDALLVALYWTYVYRVNTSRFMMMHLERVGIPLLVGHAESDLEELKDRMKEAYQDSVLAVDTTANVAFASGSQPQNQQFTGVLTELSREIVTLILGGTLTSGTDGGSGNRALGQVHDEVRMDKRDADIKMVTSSVQNVINALMDLNGFDSEIPTISFGSRKNLNQEQANRDATLLNSGALKFTQKYFEDEYNFDPEHIIVDTSPGAAREQPISSVRQSSLSDLTLALNLALQRFGPEALARLDRLAAELTAAGRVIAPEEIEAIIMTASDQADFNRRLGKLAAEAAGKRPGESLVEAMQEAEALGYLEAQKHAIPGS